MRDDETTHRHHVRRVKWLIKNPIDLTGDRFFVQSTLWPLNRDDVDEIRQAYRDAYPGDGEISTALVRLFETSTDGEDKAMSQSLAEAEKQLADRRKTA